MMANGGCQLFSQSKVKQYELQLPPDCLCCHLRVQLATICSPHQDVAWVKISAENDQLHRFVHKELACSGPLCSIAKHLTSNTHQACYQRKSCSRVHEVVCQQHLEVCVHSQGYYLGVEGRWIPYVLGYTLACTHKQICNHTACVQDMQSLARPSKLKTPVILRAVMSFVAANIAKADLAQMSR